jgi:hypothetical protein
VHSYEGSYDPEGSRRVFKSACPNDLPLGKTGQIPSLKVGGSWRFKKENVDSWFSETKYSVSRGKRSRRSEGRQQAEFDKLYEGKDQSPL